MRNTFFLSIFIILSSALNAQYTISGTITDMDNRPVKQVVVSLDNGSSYTSTDDSGKYTLPSTSGEHELSISHIGYEDYTRAIQVKDNLILDVKLGLSINVMDEILISAIREDAQSPMSFSSMDKEALGDHNLGQDLPILLNFLPSVVTTSDAGAGIGYTGMRVRGSDASRVNITINGVPYNDSESQGTFWVDLPDFTSSVENAQLVRGVGSSTNGSGAFGANLSLLTDGISSEPSTEIATSMGSFKTRKASLKFNTGLINDHINFVGRLSRIKSDGYIDRASSDLSSYFTQLSYVNENTIIKALAFGGLEETYQSWYGIDPETMKEDRTHNYAGEHYDEEGNTLYYDNQVDHYNQDHYQLLINHKLNENFNFNLTGHYTRGKGYYEQYKEDAYLSEYGINNIVLGMDTITNTDLIRRKWLDNDFYGAIASMTYEKKKINSTLGMSFNRYKGDHFGEIIWAQFTGDSQIRDHYYDFYGNKDEQNVFWKNSYNFSDALQLFTDLQWRNVQYEGDGLAEKVVADSFTFFNPKIGLSYQAKNGLAYISYAIANKEPSRSDYENGNPEHESLSDMELGYRFKVGNSKINMNAYYMNYTNQLVLTGALDDTGSPIKTNVGKSFRVGLELDAYLVLNNKLSIIPNFTLSENNHVNYHIITDQGVQNLGNTKISFSPEIIAGNIIRYNPVKSLIVSAMSKYVGEQFMGNVEAPLSRLEAYFVNDISVNYTIYPKKTFKAIGLSMLFNNILNESYESNGYWGPGYVGYYPQAGFNWLGGVSLKF